MGAWSSTRSSLPCRSVWSAVVPSQSKVTTITKTVVNTDRLFIVCFNESINLSFAYFHDRFFVVETQPLTFLLWCCVVRES